MKITSVKATAYTLAQRHETSSAGMAKAVGTIPGVLIRVESDTGHSGIGEVSGHPIVYGESQRSILDIVNNYLARNLVGLDPLDIERLGAALNAPRGVAYALSAKAGIDMAVYDLIGRELNVPVFKYLGGWSDPPTVPLSWLLSLGAPEAISAEAKGRVAQGFNAFKIKIGRDAKRDVETIATLRRDLGDQILLYADANEAYPPDVAKRVLHQVEEFDLAWLEDPCQPTVPADVRRSIAQSTTIPVMGDMSCHNAQAVLRELQQGTIGMVHLKLFRTGFTESKRIVQISEQFGVPCVVGTCGESTISAMAGAHVAAGLRNIRLPAEVSYPLLLEDEIVTSETTRVSGPEITLDPSAPGIGVEVDEAKLSQYSEQFNAEFAGA